MSKNNTIISALIFTASTILFAIFGYYYGFTEIASGIRFIGIFSLLFLGVKDTADIYEDTITYIAYGAFVARKTDKQLPTNELRSKVINLAYVIVYVIALFAL
jgi:hypothetical protein